MSKRILVLTSVVAMLIVGCEKAEYSLEDIDPTYQGKFLDEAVEGLEYKGSSGKVHLTSNGGYYEYKANELLGFYVGALNLGSSHASEIITPRELAGNTAVISDAVVSNRIRFMLALDSNKSRIGIQISPKTRKKAQFWESSLDFSLTDGEFQEEIRRVTKAPVYKLPSRLMSKEEAITHFEKTLRCAYSGGYEGSWVSNKSNEKFGFVGAMIQAAGQALIMGSVQNESNETSKIVYMTGTHDIDDKVFSFATSKSPAYYFDAEARHLIPMEGSAIYVDAYNKTYNYAKGEFINIIEGSHVIGKFELNRADALSNAAYRYTGYGYPHGTIESEESIEDIVGMVIFDINASGTVSGMIHDVSNPFDQPRLHGQVDYTTGEISIVIESTPKAVLRGVLNFTNTSRDVKIDWFSAKPDTGPIGYVKVSGCQLQAVE